MPDSYSLSLTEAEIAGRKLALLGGEWCIFGTLSAALVREYYGLSVVPIAIPRNRYKHRIVKAMTPQWVGLGPWLIPREG